jgi:hypothetical protein
MIETFYKTETPVRGSSECFVLVLTSRASSGRKAYDFMLERGQWNDEHQRFVYVIESASTGESLSHEQATSLYENAKRRLAQQGFVHAFRPDCVRKGPQNYRCYADEQVLTA